MQLKISFTSLGGAKIFAVAVFLGIYLHNWHQMNRDTISKNCSHKENLAAENKELEKALEELQKLKQRAEEMKDKIDETPQDIFFPFRIVDSARNCVKKERIIAIRNAVKDLNEKHKIRVFPRNGFLLGVIRHGGFLPTENIDADLGVVFSDLQRAGVNNLSSQTLGDIKLSPSPTGKTWANWKGINPLNGKPYTFFGVDVSRSSLSESMYSFYPYHNDTVFYPRANIQGFNHEGNTNEMLRWNKEGANYQLVDRNELVSDQNFEVGKQIGTVYQPDTFDCMVEKQFYFTTILVPCGYDGFLQAQYGKNYRRSVEKRNNWESVKISEEQNKQFLNGGPLPVCGGTKEPEMLATSVHVSKVTTHVSKADSPK